MAKQIHLGVALHDLPIGDRQIGRIVLKRDGNHIVQTMSWNYANETLGWRDASRGTPNWSATVVAAWQYLKLSTEKSQREFLRDYRGL
jgi:hypothetical protein